MSPMHVRKRKSNSPSLSYDVDRVATTTDNLNSEPGCRALILTNAVLRRLANVSVQAVADPDCPSEIRVAEKSGATHCPAAIV